MTMRGLNHTIIEQLSNMLQLPVEVDTSGWLREWAELRFVLGEDRTIQPTSLRITDDEANEHRLRDVNIAARCERYNLAIVELRKLRDRYAALAQRGYLIIASGSSLWLTGRSLLNLDLDVERHQLNVMSNNAVGISVLDRECEFLESYYRRLSAIVEQAEALEEEVICEADTVNKALDAES